MNYIFLDVDDVLMKQNYEAFRAYFLKKGVHNIDTLVPEAAFYNRPELHFYKSFPALLSSRLDELMTGLMVVFFYGFGQTQKVYEPFLNEEFARCLSHPRLYLLSRQPPWGKKIRLRRLREIFGEGVTPKLICAMTNWLKPKSKGRIIQKFMKKNGVSAQNIFFFDDDPKNILSALRLGIPATLVETSYNYKASKSLKKDYPELFSTIAREAIPVVIVKLLEEKTHS